MKTLSMQWQRLVNEAGQTCERCDSTGNATQKAFEKLQRSLAELGIHVQLETNILDFSTFTKDPLQSNRIWIGGRPLEEWVDAKVGRSQCCDVCGSSECRTVSVEGTTYETIPEELIIRAGLLAAAELFEKGKSECCIS
jgi:hypothetical protein